MGTNGIYINYENTKPGDRRLVITVKNLFFLESHQVYEMVIALTAGWHYSAKYACPQWQMKLSTIQKTTWHQTTIYYKCTWLTVFRCDIQYSFHFFHLFWEKWLICKFQSFFYPMRLLKLVKRIWPHQDWAMLFISMLLTKTVLLY